MDHISFLHVDQRIDYLPDDVLSLFLCEELLLPEFLVQVAILSILQHHVDALLIVEVPEEADDVRMSKAPLDLQLFLHLCKEVKLLQQVLLDHL